MSGELPLREGYTLVHPFDEIFFVTPYGWQPPQRFKHGWIIHPSKSSYEDSNAVQTGLLASMNFAKMRKVINEREIVCDSCALHIFCMREIVDAGFPDVVRVLEKIDSGKGCRIPEQDRVFVSLHCMCKRYLDNMNCWTFWLDRFITEMRILSTILVLMESRDIKWPKVLTLRGFDKDTAVCAMVNEMIALVSTVWDALTVDVCPSDRTSEIADMLSLCEIVCVMFNCGPYEIGEIVVEGVVKSKEVVVCKSAKARGMILLSFYAYCIRNFLRDEMSLEVITDAFFDFESMRNTHKFHFYFVQATEPLLGMLNTPRTNVRSLLYKLHESFFHPAFNETFDEYVVMMSESKKRRRNRGKKKSNREQGLSGLLKMKSTGKDISSMDYMRSYEDLDCLRADKMALEMIAAEGCSMKKA